jgi:hypothetical protein
MPQPLQTNQGGFSDEGETLTKDERNGTALPWAESHDGTVNTPSEGSGLLMLHVMMMMVVVVVAVALGFTNG